MPQLWTIGHSILTIDAFINLLKAQEIQKLVDVRTLPGSKRHPQFNAENLSQSLHRSGIDYIHMKELGGLRKPRPDSPNTIWRNASFRGYADYMMTTPFVDAIEKLLKIAAEKRTAIMCAEAVWWQCHRSMIADYLKARGVKVLHILGEKKIQEHPYTSAARIVDGLLTYSVENEPELRP
ncbi:MAG: Fe-S cluster assembly protein HesB [Verrucomicrobiales bacterium]|nr:Fe-S cluster assembly protein HesB [Verrucomicrobiales bacterium]